VKVCDKCQRVGNIGRRNEIPMNHSLPLEPFDVWGFDFMGPFPASNTKHTHILVAVDYFTEWVEAIPTKSADHATTITRLKDIIFPKYLITDGGSHFLHGVLRKTLAKYGVDNRVRSPYHPQTSGQVELSNRELKSILEKTVNRSISDKGIVSKARYLSTPGPVRVIVQWKLGPSIAIVEIRDDIVYR
jgi:hypothetical protein